MRIFKMENSVYLLVLLTWLCYLLNTSGGVLVAYHNHCSYFKKIYPLIAGGALTYNGISRINEILEFRFASTKSAQNNWWLFALVTKNLEGHVTISTRTSYSFIFFFFNFIIILGFTPLIFILFLSRLFFLFNIKF